MALKGCSRPVDSGGYIRPRAAPRSALALVVLALRSLLNLGRVPPGPGFWAVLASIFIAFVLWNWLRLNARSLASSAGKLAIEERLEPHVSEALSGEGLELLELWVSEWSNPPGTRAELKRLQTAGPS